MFFVFKNHHFPLFLLILKPPKSNFCIDFWSVWGYLEGFFFFDTFSATFISLTGAVSYFYFIVGSACVVKVCEPFALYIYDTCSILICIIDTPLPAILGARGHSRQRKVFIFRLEFELFSNRNRYLGSFLTPFLGTQNAPKKRTPSLFLELNEMKTWAAFWGPKAGAKN